MERFATDPCKPPKPNAGLKTFGFGLRGLKSYPELIPLATIISAALMGATSFVLYALTTKPDVRLHKSSDLPPWERVKPTEPKKMRVVNWDIYQPNPELEELREEIGGYRP